MSDSELCDGWLPYDSCWLGSNIPGEMPSNWCINCIRYVLMWHEMCTTEYVYIFIALSFLFVIVVPFVFSGIIMQYS